MKLSFTKFTALAVSIIMLVSLTAIAETTAANLPEKDVAVDTAITSDAVSTSDADEVITSDADEVITSDADEVIASDADEVIASDAAVNFTDLSSDDWAYDAILNLTLKGIVSGDTVGTIRPDGNVTREEVAKMMVVSRRFAIVQDTAIEASDADSVSDWAKGYFKTAIEKGIINGYTDGTVRGTGAVNRAEMATIIVRSINASVEGFNASSFTDITETDWYAKYVECAKTLGIVNGYQDGSFRGEDLVTRREAFAMIERMVRLIEALEA